MNAAERLWRAISLQDWAGVAAQLQPNAVVELPVSGERLVGPEAYVLSLRLRPGEQVIKVIDTVSGEQIVAVHAVVTTETATEHVMGFYDLHETRIAHAVELWTVAPGQPLGGNTISR